MPSVDNFTKPTPVCLCVKTNSHLNITTNDSPLWDQNKNEPTCFPDEDIDQAVVAST